MEEDDAHEVEQAEQKQLPRGRHISKRALKNKSLSVSFNEKDLRDFVTGFHKRKKKRRKEAQRQQEEALRKKRIEQRKKRKLEKDLVLFGGLPPPENTETGEIDADNFDEEDEATEPHESTSGTMVYDTGHVKVTVTTSEISREDESIPPSAHNALEFKQARPSRFVKTYSLAVSKKKPFKRVSRQKPRRSSHKKSDKVKGKKNKKRH